MARRLSLPTFFGDGRDRERGGLARIKDVGISAFVALFLSD